MLPLSTCGSNNQFKNNCLYERFTEVVRVEGFVYPSIYFGCKQANMVVSLQHSSNDPHLQAFTLLYSPFSHCTRVVPWHQMEYGRIDGIWLLRLGHKRPQLSSRALSRRTNLINHPWISFALGKPSALSWRHSGSCPVDRPTWQCTETTSQQPTRNWGLQPTAISPLGSAPHPLQGFQRWSSGQQISCNISQSSWAEPVPAFWPLDTV